MSISKSTSIIYQPPELQNNALDFINCDKIQFAFLCVKIDISKSIKRTRLVHSYETYHVQQYLVNIVFCNVCNYIRTTPRAL